jgi:hypothetical protein
MNTKVLNKYFLFVSFFFSESHFCIESVAQSLLCRWESELKVRKKSIFEVISFPFSSIVLSPQTYKAKGNLYLYWCLLYSDFTSSFLSFNFQLSVFYITYDFIFTIFFFLNLISFINFSDFSPRLQLISQIFDFISSYKLWKKWKEIGFNEKLLIF